MGMEEEEEDDKKTCLNSFVVMLDFLVSVESCLEALKSVGVTFIVVEEVTTSRAVSVGASEGGLRGLGPEVEDFVTIEVLEFALK